MLHFRGALATLALSAVGSAILPIPYAFRCTGVALGVALASTVAVLNAYTCSLLLRAAQLAGGTRERSYEALAYAAAGRAGRACARGGLLILLLGSLCGNFIVLVEVLSRGLREAGAPAAVHASHSVAAACSVLLLLLSLPRHFDFLERPATAAMGVLVVLAGCVVYAGAQAGLPALFSNDAGGRAAEPWAAVGARTPSAVGVLGYAMYLHPQLLPVRAEMAQGKNGADEAAAAVRWTLGCCLVLYVVVGSFGFGAWGDDTRRDVLDNLGGPPGWTTTVALATSFYLAVGFPTCVLPLRSSIEQLCMSPEASTQLTWCSTSNVALTAALVLSTAAAAWVLPGSASEVVFAFTGATGVCLICYVLPVWIYWRLVERAAAGAGSDAEAPLLQPDSDIAAAGPLPRRGSRNLTLTDEAGDGVEEAPTAPLTRRDKIELVCVAVVGCLLSALAVASVFIDARHLKSDAR